MSSSMVDFRFLTLDARFVEPLGALFTSVGGVRTLSPPNLGVDMGTMCQEPMPLLRGAAIKPNNSLLLTHSTWSRDSRRLYASLSGTTVCPRDC